MEQLTTLEALSAKMGEYTKMDEEISFEEFQSYYTSLMNFLQAEYQNLTEDELVQAKGMTMIVAGNAKMRALRKDANRKKFDKMGQKAAFWEDAIRRRLVKEGMSENVLDEKVGGLWE